MLRIMHIEELRNLLLRVPELVRKHEQRAPEFVSDVVAWLASLEQALTSNRLHQAGTIASVRSGLVAVVQGHIPSTLQFRGRPTRGKITSAAASQAIQQASALVSSLIDDNEKRFTEAERVAHQIVSVAAVRGLTGGNTSSNTQLQLRAFRARLSATDDLQAAAVHLEGLVGPYDALVLIDRALATRSQN